MAKPKVICFGEVLWDVFPNGKVPGGAPLNAAFHFKNFGVEVLLASRIGQDQLGEELRGFIEDKGLDLSLLQVDEKYPTSTSLISLDAEGHASYEIVEPVAWDFISVQDKLARAVASSSAFIYGSLPCRNAVSYKSLQQLLNIAPFVVFDVNLRPPHYEKSIIQEMMNKADLVKMNEEELDILSGWFGSGSTEHDQLKFLLDTFKLQGVIVTKGKDGAAFMSESGYFTMPAYPIIVVDTVGSGDAFLAAFITKYIEGQAPRDCLDFACATGALVASRKGGTPAISELEIQKMRNNHHQP